MRIFIDANIILIGALAPNSAARSLIWLSFYHQFVFTEQIEREVHNKIDEYTIPGKIRTKAKQEIQNFLKGLEALSIPPGDPRNADSVSNPYDKAHYSAAKESGCDCICTYDFTDFSELDLPITTPANLIQEYAVETKSSDLSLFFDYIGLEEEGTVLFIGQIIHPTGIGKILTARGFRIEPDENGYIVIKGTDAIKSNPKAKPEANIQIGLSIRYKNNFIEIEEWRSKTEEWDNPTDFSKRYLTTGKAKFHNPIRSLISGDKGFNGFVKHFGVHPWYHKDKSIRNSLTQLSLRPHREIWSVKQLIQLFKSSFNGKR
ncbi:hypothetical protein ACG2F4_13445 [Halalkalibaculum sp. DA3122]|uniref:hypothetical protein n=1 Tax=Halalkalibaculum sp. DA3122 TaxID=3373607 RepID=UPI003753FB5B